MEKNQENKIEELCKNFISQVDVVAHTLNAHYDSIKLLLNHVSQPLKVDDRGLARTIMYAHDQFKEILHAVKSLDLNVLTTEIRYMMHRIEELEKKLEKVLVQHSTIEAYFSDILGLIADVQLKQKQKKPSKSKAKKRAS